MKQRYTHVLVLSGFLLLTRSALAFLPPAQVPLPNLDLRPKQEPVSASADQSAALAKLRAKVPSLAVDFMPVTGSPGSVSARESFLTGPGGQGKSVSAGSLAGFASDDPNRVTKAFLKDHSLLFGFGPEALEHARVSREFVTPHSGLRSVVWEQQVDGIPVFEAVLISHTTTKGELVNLCSQFIPDAGAAAGQSALRRAAQPAALPVSALQAVALAAQHLGVELQAGAVAFPAAAAGPEQRQKFKAPGLSGEGDARLTWLPMNRNTLRLCWDVILTSRARGEMYRLLIDAQTSQTVVRRCLTDYLTDASYRVFTSDSPSPFSPGQATPVTTQPPSVSRALVTLSALDTNASPLGWINDGGNETLGNNVDAHTDSNADNSPDLPRPQGSPSRVFDFMMDPATQDPLAYAPASVVQLFYLNNWMHDRLYQLGFTEAAGNFQSDNFGRGGLGNDAVQADAQDGSGYNNANFSTPPDGSPGRMQMFIFTTPSPRRDGDVDAEIVLHEYAHGFSNRRVGGGVGISALQSQGMGEGWSDFYALSLLSEAGDDVNGNYAAGAYASYQIGGTSDQYNYYFGIRRYPYTTDLSRNPLTFKDIDPSQADYCSSGAPYHTTMFGPCSSGTASEVHNMGEVWCAALWDARANLINRYGWTVGNQLILQLVTDGMNLSPANPNFLQARDAILQADLVNNGGANRGELWAAFAKRGMGFTATSPSSSTASGVHEAFDLPDDLLITPGSGLISSGPVGGPFTPASASFTLTNAGNAPLSWTAVNPAAWLDLSPTGGTLIPAGPSATVAASINASANSLPMGVYSGTVWFTNLNSLIAQNRQFMLRIGQPDYFTELFDTTPNNLAYQTFTFTPNGSSSFYSVCREPASSFPTDSAGAATVSLTDDSYAAVTLTGTNTVAIYNTRSGTFYIGSNGYLTLNSGDSEYAESFASHFNRPRVSALFRDLYPPAGGAIYRQELSDRAVVTFQGICEIGTTLPNYFQIELFYNGRIRLTYLAVNSPYNLAGLSAGQSVPTGFVESDLSSLALCAPPDALQVTPGTGLASQGYAGGPFAPSSATYTVSNADTNSLLWSASVSQPWLAVDLPGGALDPAAATNLTVSLNAAAQSLVPGAYAATVTFSNRVTGYRQTRTASLLVQAIPGDLLVLDSIPPTSDLRLPFGDVTVSLSRTERLLLLNSGAYPLQISNISLGGGLYTEDFNDGLAQNWMPDLTNSWQVVGGEYRAQTGDTDFMISRYAGQEWTDLTLQATCRRTGGAGNSACVVLRASPDFDDAVGSGYVFQLAADGSYSVWKQIGGSWSWLQPWTLSSAVSTGTNVLAAVAQGAQLRLYINGTLVWSGSDSSLSAGRIGVMGYSTAAAVATHFFDNVTVGAPVSLTALGAEQDWYNQHAVPGGRREFAPAAKAPGYPGQPDPRPSPGASLASLAATNGPWLLHNLTNFPYTLPPLGSLTLDVTYSPTAVASNETKVVIESNDADTPHAEVLLSGQGVPDSLWVTPAGAFSFQGPTGGPFSPASAPYTLSNTGPAAIHWTVSHAADWLTLSATNGTLAANESVGLLIAFALSADSLPVGLWSDTLTFSNSTTGAVQPRGVALTVQTPVIAVTRAGVALLAEDCNPGNGVIDPNETVTLNLGLLNAGNASAPDVVATLLPTGGVTSPSGPHNYGTLLAGGPAVSNAFAFTASGACGGTLVATLQLSAGTADLGTVSFSFPLGVSDAVFAEDFDGVTAPNLPSGWTTYISGAGSPWAASTALQDTPPNAVFASDPGATSENWLTSPTIPVPASGGQLSFRHAYNTESCCDAGWLQISIAGGAFADFLAAGGSFLTNGYPAGSGWRGTSSGYPAFITTIASLPAAAWNQNIRLRWRFTADSSVSGVGWFVDTVAVGGAYTCCINPGFPTHFTWDAIPSPQCVNLPFNVTIRARNDANAVATNFTGVMALSGSAGASLQTNTILPAPSFMYFGSGVYTLGYAFVPATDLTVTHVRHYFGDKVSIWTEAGALIASQAVTSTPGTWLETPLATPVQLTAGAAYRVSAYSTGGNYYWRDDMDSTFPNGTLVGSYEAPGDVFPTSSDNARWWLVDLRYAVGSTVPVPILPAVCGSFVDGVWTGSVAVPQVVSNLVLSADDGLRPAAAANPIQVLNAPAVETERYGHILLFLWPLWPAGSPTFTLQTSTNLEPSSWVPLAQPPLLIEDSYVLPVFMSDPHRYYRLKSSAP